MYQQSITILDEIIQDSNSRIGLVSCDEAQGVVVKCQVAVLVTSNRYTSCSSRWQVVSVGDAQQEEEQELLSISSSTTSY